MHTGNTGPPQALGVGGAVLAALAKVGRVGNNLVIEERGVGKACGPPEHLAFCRKQAQCVKILAMAEQHSQRSMRSKSCSMNTSLGFDSMCDPDLKGWQDAMLKLLRCTVALTNSEAG